MRHEVNMDGPLTTEKYVLDKENRVVRAKTLREWANFFESDGRFLARDVICRRVGVSTIFLGINHRFSGDGPPLVFETMVFGGRLDGYQDRYCTWEEAMRGHALAARRATVSFWFGWLPGFRWLARRLGWL